MVSGDPVGCGWRGFSCTQPSNGLIGLPASPSLQFQRCGLIGPRQLRLAGFFFERLANHTVCDYSVHFFIVGFPVSFGWRGFSLARTGRRTHRNKSLGQPPLVERRCLRSQIWAVLRYCHYAANTSDPYVHLSRCLLLPTAAIYAAKSSGRKVRFLSIQFHSVPLDQSNA